LGNGHFKVVIVIDFVYSHRSWCLGNNAFVNNNSNNNNSNSICLYKIICRLHKRLLINNFPKYYLIADIMRHMIFFLEITSQKIISISIKAF